jgi:hypothetical protein
MTLVVTGWPGHQETASSGFSPDHRHGLKARLRYWRIQHARRQWAARMSAEITDPRLLEDIGITSRSTCSFERMVMMALIHRQG